MGQGRRRHPKPAVWEAKRLTPPSPTSLSTARWQPWSQSGPRAVCVRQVGGAEGGCQACFVGCGVSGRICQGLHVRLQGPKDSLWLIVGKEALAGVDERRALTRGGR